MTVRGTQSSFNGGILDQALWGRIDLAKYDSGARAMLNVYSRAQGGADNRGGLEFIREVKDSTTECRLFSFQYSTEQSYILELGDEYMRFYQDGGLVLLPSAPSAYDGATTYDKGDFVSVSSVNYYSRVDSNTGNAPASSPDEWYPLTDDIAEIPTPYAIADVWDLTFEQQGDLITITGWNYDPAELARLDNHQWTLTDIVFGSNVTTPTGISVSSNVTEGKDWYYVVTAEDPDTGEESLQSSTGTVDGPSTWNVGDEVTISWTAVTGIETYSIYKQSNGIFGWIGSTGDTSFVDDNIEADLTITPPDEQLPFNGTGNKPRASAYFDQRRVFAGTSNQRQSFWGTQIGRYSNLNVSAPTRDDDAFNFSLVGGRTGKSGVHEILHIVSGTDLVFFTTGGEWKISGRSDVDAIGPKNILARPQSFHGCSDRCGPLPVGDTILFVEGQSAKVRDLLYTLEVDKYSGSDLSILAEDLFEGYTILDWAYQKKPHSIVWAVRSDGKLLGFTYKREHEVWGWHLHETDGLFESVEVVSEGSRDSLYCIVKRTINGSDVRYVERLNNRTFTNIEDAVFLDSALTYTGSAATTISGLDHLEGETVNALADGNVVTGLTVTSGAITLAAAASTVTVGLPYTSRIETLPFEIALGGGANSQGRRKTINKVIMRVLKSRGFQVGPDVDNLMDASSLRTGAAAGSALEPFSGLLVSNVTPTWGEDVGVVFQQTLPLPMTILSVSPIATVGT